MYSIILATAIAHAEQKSHHRALCYAYLSQAIERA
jgi:hypothetical protein